MRYFIFFAYDGTNYHGWQAQPNAASVQQQLDRALSLLLRSKIETLGAGRTDAGVHAAYMAAHFGARTIIIYIPKKILSAATTPHAFPFRSTSSA